jgi:hypothetical protein
MERLGLFSRVRQFAPLILVCVSTGIAVAAYLQSLHYSFVSDDRLYISENSKLAGLHFTELWRLLTEPYNPYEFLPLRDLSYWFDITLFGLDPSAFRLHNIILYLLCLPLIYAVTLNLWRYFRPTDTGDTRWVAAAVTALFVLHPAHIEPVIWISGRKDLVSGLFSLLALWFAVHAKLELGLSPRYAAATLFALLGAILSKATAVAVAPVITILWTLFWLDIPKQDRRHTQLLWPFASLFLAVCAAFFFTANSTVKEPMDFGIETVTRALAVLGWLARLSISPESRHFFYPVFEDPNLFVMVALGAAVLVAVIVSMAVMKHKRWLGSFMAVIFLLLCMPYTQLMPYMTNSLVADRFLFLAVWPAILLIVVLVWHLKPELRVVILVVFAMAWGSQTFARFRDWNNIETLTKNDLIAYPGHYQPAAQEIWIQLRNGLYSDAIRTANNITVPEFRNAMITMINATYSVRFSTVTTGKPDVAMARLKEVEAALKHLPAQAKWNSPMRQVMREVQYILSLKGARLAEQFPDDALVRFKAGLWKLEVNSYEDAASHLRAATESQILPESLRGSAFKNLGVALLNSGHAAEAVAPLRAALEHSPPDLQAYCSLVDLYNRTGRTKEAANAEVECRHASSETAAQ